MTEIQSPRLRTEQNLFLSSQFQAVGPCQQDHTAKREEKNKAQDLEQEGKELLI